MTAQKRKTRDLREACVQEALAIIETAGLEALSLREISRRLGVSHQAPYKHFPNRDYVLAEIVSRAFDAFAVYLDEQLDSDDPQMALNAMGRAYFNYARNHPLQYRLMFGTPLPDPEQHPQMMNSARHAFSLLRDCIFQIRVKLGQEVVQNEIERDTLFVWSAIHGLATILQTSALNTLSLPNEVLASVTEHTLLRIGTALDFQAGLESDS